MPVQALHRFLLSSLLFSSEIESSHNKIPLVKAQKAANQLGNISSVLYSLRGLVALQSRYFTMLFLDRHGVKACSLVLVSVGVRRLLFFQEG